MSYQQSRARRNFESQLVIARQEAIALHGLARQSGAGTRLLAAYYVFAYSQMEVYIKSFVEDCIDAFNSSSPTLDKWPDLMLGFLLHKGHDLEGCYRRFSENEDEKAILEKMGRTARNIESWSTGAGGPSATNAAHVLDRKKYPSPKNLPHLFRRLGVGDIWAIVGRAGRFNGVMILTSLNDLRTGIVHDGRFPPGFGLIDFRDNLEKMRRFVAAIDRGISGHFCSGIIPRKGWNGLMT